MCCFVFPSSAHQGLNKQALTPTAGKDGRPQPGVLTQDAGVQTGANLSANSQTLALESPSREASVDSIYMVSGVRQAPMLPVSCHVKTAQGCLFLQPG